MRWNLESGAGPKDVTKRGGKLPPYGQRRSAAHCDSVLLCLFLVDMYQINIRLQHCSVAQVGAKEPHAARGCCQLCVDTIHGCGTKLSGALEPF